MMRNVPPTVYLYEITLPYLEECGVYCHYAFSAIPLLLLGEGAASNNNLHRPVGLMR